MKALNHLLGVLAVLVTLAASSHASTTVNAGSIGVITGPNDLDLLGEIVYAVNFSANDPALTVNEVVFSPDTPAPAGASFVLPLNVAPWQTKPEFGDSLSDNNLEEIFQDIRYADTSVGGRLEAHFAVTAGDTYKIQILINGNHATDDRRWDIEVEGAISVDEITSLGGSIDGTVPLYDPGTGVVFTQTVTVAHPFPAPAPRSKFLSDGHSPVDQGRSGPWRGSLQNGPGRHHFHPRRACSRYSRVAGERAG